MAEFGKLNFSTSFNRTSAFPIEANGYFTSYAEAEAAARTAVEVGSAESTYYIGETLTVVADGTSKCYIIQPDKTLKEIGASSSTEKPQGSTNYTDLNNKPSINNVVLVGNKTLNDLGVQAEGDYALKSEIPNVANLATKTELTTKQDKISTVKVNIDNNTGTPSATASVSGNVVTFDFKNLKGLKGDKGETGAAGVQGPAGPQGATGATGPAGPKGKDGVDGAAGAQGPIGPIGPRGEKGEKGDKGDIGPQGPAGSGADVVSIDITPIFNYIMSDINNKTIGVQHDITLTEEYVTTLASYKDKTVTNAFLTVATNKLLFNTTLSISDKSTDTQTYDIIFTVSLDNTELDDTLSPRVLEVIINTFNNTGKYRMYPKPFIKSEPKGLYFKDDGTWGNPDENAIHSVDITELINIIVTNQLSYGVHEIPLTNIDYFNSLKSYANKKVLQFIFYSNPQDESIPDTEKEKFILKGIIEYYLKTDVRDELTITFDCNIAPLRMIGLPFGNICVNVNFKTNLLFININPYPNVLNKPKGLFFKDNGEWSSAGLEYINLYNYVNAEGDGDNIVPSKAAEFKELITRLTNDTNTSKLPTYFSIQIAFWYCIAYVETTSEDNNFKLHAIAFNEGGYNYNFQCYINFNTNKFTVNEMYSNCNRDLMDAPMFIDLFRIVDNNIIFSTIIEKQMFLNKLSDVSKRRVIVSTSHGIGTAKVNYDSATSKYKLECTITDGIVSNYEGEELNKLRADIIKAIYTIWNDPKDGEQHLSCTEVVYTETIVTSLENKKIVNYITNLDFRMIAPNQRLSQAEVNEITKIADIIRYAAIGQINIYPMKDDEIEYKFGPCNVIIDYDDRHITFKVFTKNANFVGDPAEYIYITDCDNVTTNSVWSVYPANKTYSLGVTLDSVKTNDPISIIDQQTISRIVNNYDKGINVTFDGSYGPSGYGCIGSICCNLYDDYSHLLIMTVIDDEVVKLSCDPTNFEYNWTVERIRIKKNYLLNINPYTINNEDVVSQDIKGDLTIICRNPHYFNVRFEGANVPVPINANFNVSGNKICMIIPYANSSDDSYGELYLYTNVGVPNPVWKIKKFIYT